MFVTKKKSINKSIETINVSLGVELKISHRVFDSYVSILLRQR